jgi:cobyrinic acid a,c-diamide synthase
MDLKLDSAGIVAVLNSGEVAAAVAGLAEGIASQVRGQVDAIDGVVVDRYTTDRAAASVTIKDPRAKLWEARDGVLTRAAAGQGLEVTAR